MVASPVRAFKKTIVKPKKPKPDLGELPVVAWIGTNYDGMGEVVWCKTRGQAKSAAAAALECDFQEVVSLKRYPELDDFKGNLRQWLLDHGWWFECQKCGGRCYGAEQGEGSTVVLDEHGHVFCSPEHQQEYEAYWGQTRAIDQAILQDFKKLHPDIEIPNPSMSVGHNEWYGWVDCALGRVTVWEMVSVHRVFVTPSPAHWVNHT